MIISLTQVHQPPPADGLRDIHDAVAFDGVGSLQFSLKFNLSEKKILQSVLARLNAFSGLDSNALVSFNVSNSKVGAWKPLVRQKITWLPIGMEGPPFLGSVEIVKGVSDTAFGVNIRFNLIRVVQGSPPQILKASAEEMAFFRKALANLIAGVPAEQKSVSAESSTPTLPRGRVDAFVAATNRDPAPASPKMAMPVAVRLSQGMAPSPKVVPVPPRFNPKITQWMAGLTKPPVEAGVLKASADLKLPLDEIIHAVNHHFYGTAESLKGIFTPETHAQLCRYFPGKTLVDLLADVFPGKAIFLDPVSLDAEKIIAYAQKPDTIGQYLFLHRKSQPGLPSSEDFAGPFNRSAVYWDSRETNTVSLTRENLAGWVRCFLDFNLPMADLARLSGCDFLNHENPVTLLVQGMGRQSQNEIIAASGLRETLFTRLLIHFDKHKFTAETFAALCEALPELEGGKLYRLMHPEIVQFFPEAGNGDPYLDLSDLNHFDIFKLNPGELIFSYRMEHLLERYKLQDITGLAESTISQLELAGSNVESDQTLKNLAPLLAEQIFREELEAQGLLPAVLRGRRFVSLKDLSEAGMTDLQNAQALFDTCLTRALRIIYVYFKSPVLSVFKVKMLPRAVPAKLDLQVVRGFAMRKQDRLRGQNVRPDLMTILAARLQKADPGLPIPADAKAFGPVLIEAMNGKINLNKAGDYLNASRYVSLADIYLLKEMIPEVDLQDWYEYVNHAALEYYLGMNGDGRINYSLPAGITWDDIENPDFMMRLIQEKIRAVYGTATLARKSTGLRSVETSKRIREEILGVNPPDITIARLAQGLKVDRRLLYFYFRREPLKRVIAEMKVVPPPVATPKLARPRPAPPPEVIRRGQAPLPLQPGPHLLAAKTGLHMPGRMSGK